MMEDLLRRLTETITSARPWTLIGIASSAAALESIFPPVPSETIIVLCAFAAARVGLNPVELFAAATAASVLSLYALFLVGRSPFGGRVRAFLARRAPRADALASRLFERYGALLLVLSRFIPGSRGLVACLVGSYGLGRRRAAVLIVASSLVWYAFYVGIGYCAGHLWDGALHSLPGIAFSVWLALLGLTGASLWIRSRLVRS